MSLVATRRSDHTADYGTPSEVPSTSWLAKHGEFAVPALFEKLGDSDSNVRWPDPRDQCAVAAARRRGAAADRRVEQLRAALMVQNACAAALLLIGDQPRAADDGCTSANDDRANVQHRSLQEVRREARCAVAATRSTLMLAQANSYLQGQRSRSGGYSSKSSGSSSR